MSAPFLVSAARATAMPPAPKAAGGNGWQQELQRAQATGWFWRADGLAPREASLPPSSGAPGKRAIVAGAAIQAPKTQAGAVAGSNAHDAARTPAASLTRTDAARPPVEAPDAQAETTASRVDAAQPALRDPVASMRRVASPARDAVEALPRPATPLRNAGSPRDLHVHVEKGDAGELHVWLGIPGSACAMSESAGAAWRLVGTGLRIASLTCNGRLLYQARKDA